MSFALLLAVVLVVALLLVGMFVAVRFSRRESALEDEVKSGDVPSLRYHVPEGQDAAALLGALRSEGFEAVADHEARGQAVLISCPGGTERQRARVREVLQHAAVNMEGDHQESSPVRFADE